MKKTRTNRLGLEELLAQVRACRTCEAHLPFEPRPVLRASATSRILIVGQAPSTRVHMTGIPWNDPSGDRLRQWMNVDRDAFYDESRVAIIPMGFCYPGKGRSGDLPPRKECARIWLDRLLAELPRVELKILCGQYALRHHLGRRMKNSIAETVRAWREYLPEFITLPHPSPRNLNWFRTNPWFEAEVVPYLQKRVPDLLSKGRSNPSPR